MIDLIVGLCGTIILLFICYVLASSKYQRNWNKFTVSWYKKKKFNPKTLQPFDKVLCWNGNDCVWECDFFSYYKEDELHPCVCINSSYICVIPYNNKTKKSSFNYGYVLN